MGENEGDMMTRFRQQRLKAWQPILTVDTVLPAFFLIGLIFVPLGVALLLVSEGVVEISVDYTDCMNKEGMACKDVIADITKRCTCELTVNVDQDMEKPVFMYYGLENFYQNHRRYVKSRDDRQLAGMRGAIVQDCVPFDLDAHDKPYAPAGAIANSLFNDTLKLMYKNTHKTEQEPVPVIRTGIAWDSDRNIKFKNPPGPLNNNKGGAFENTVKPRDWDKPVWKLDEQNPDNNGYQNEDLIVWMRTAAFPNFKKLYRKVDHEQQAFKTGVTAGNYTLEVGYNYPVNSFGGRKKMILSTTSFLGGHNNFLGYAYMTVGCICFLLGVVFLVIHVKYGERTTNLLSMTQHTPYHNN